MGKLTGVRGQLLMAGSMFLVSIFMTISYYFEIAQGDADLLTHIAFYVWIVSIVAWFIKVIHDGRIMWQQKND